MLGVLTFRQAPCIYCLVRLFLLSYISECWNPYPNRKRSKLNTHECYHKYIDSRNSSSVPHPILFSLPLYKGLINIVFNTVNITNSDVNFYYFLLRAFSHIFETISIKQATKFLIHASFLEIYNEDIRDLLGKDVKQKLELKEHPEKGVYVNGKLCSIKHLSYVPFLGFRTLNHIYSCQLLSMWMPNIYCCNLV